ncbi:MAG: 2OG-Fe(II) oxygenase [Aliivibrio sp.]|uniref:2OG-Fe(II) oxygenase n=1 Tax=Aliivibrio sp. TaxID=1872443 RepID=UPI001A465BEE|nr:2OG-Fe(II) oxygenase [Aliivibrio sp.]
MWLNDKKISNSALSAYRVSLLESCPNHIVIDNLFNPSKLDEIASLLQQSHQWKTQQHTYSALYVDGAQWENATPEQRFVQRDVWCRETIDSNNANSSIAHDFLSYLRSDDFMSVLSRIFNVQITDMNVEDPEINTNYFRLGASDFVEQHADDSPGREVCMLIYLNKAWSDNSGGELVFIGENEESVSISPLFNRCVLFDPSSNGSEHWVNRLNAEYSDQYRYNITSWYWSE